MIINRHNYEELFLLYVDNELCPADRKTVEEFAKQNSDLAAELLLLKQAIAPNIDDITFDNKHELLRTGNGINLQNYETYFLLQVDDELTHTEQAEVERFVLQHPNLQQSFSLLQKTKLEPEQLLFAHKNDLYRTDRKRVIPLYLYRIAAAAVFIGIMLFIYTLKPTENNRADEQAYAATPAPKLVNPVTPNTQKKVVNQLAANTSLPEAAVIEKQLLPGNKKIAIKQVAITKNIEATSLANNKLPINKIPKNPVSERQNTLVDIATVIPQQNNQNEDVAVVKPRNILPENTLVKQTINTTKEEQLIKPTLYKELDTRREDEDNSVLFGSTQINKNKLRGLLKKATRLFDKNADKSDNDKPIQIASFELKGK